MATRKTIHLTDLIEEVNLVNQTSTLTTEQRQGMCLFLESILRKCDAYAGFGNYDADGLKGNAIGQPPGIIYGYNEAGERDNRFNVYPDDYRRFYYIHRKLK